VEAIWASLELTVTPHGRDTTKEGTYILSGVEDIFTQLEDSQVVIGTIKGSRYLGPVKNVGDIFFLLFKINNREINGTTSSACASTLLPFHN
jgi:hypothetical protein